MTNELIQKLEAAKLVCKGSDADSFNAGMNRAIRIVSEHSEWIQDRAWLIAVRSIAEYPISDPKNMDASNMREIARFIVNEYSKPAKNQAA